MHLVSAARTPSNDTPGFAYEDLSGAPLSVVFADGTAIEAVRARGEGELVLEPPFHVSDEDLYLVLPSDIGLELVDILRDGDTELLAESLRDGIIAVGGIGRGEDGAVALEVERAFRASELIGRLPFAAEIELDGSGDPLALVNALPHLRVTVASRFADDDGLDAILGEPEHVGVSWSVPAGKASALSGAEPTYAWSRRQANGTVGVELALFLEYEELVVVLRPIAFIA